MANLLVAVLITGMAVTYAIEFLDLVTYIIVEKSFLNKLFPMPLSLGALYLLGYWDLKLIVAVPAAAFLSLIINKYLNKPVVFEARRQLPRL
jgi:hypothetical protein